MKSQAIEKAAQALIEAAQNKQAIAPVREWIGADDVDAAYAVQQIITHERLNRGARRVGSKIGLTSKAVQAQLGVDQPDYGSLFADMEVSNAGSLSFDLLMQPKAEAEIAFVMEKDLTGEVTEEALKDAIGHATAAIEIVGSRVQDWNIRITDTIADNASASHFVLGTQKVPLDELDLVGCKMSMRKNGEVVSEGQGSACLGSPLIAALWLAETMSQLGQPLKKGDIILSGALGPMCNLEQGDALTAEIEGLGHVQLHIS